jgi:hypothetical protein
LITPCFDRTKEDCTTLGSAPAEWRRLGPEKLNSCPGRNPPILPRVLKLHGAVNGSLRKHGEDQQPEKKHMNCARWNRDLSIVNWVSTFSPAAR